MEVIDLLLGRGTWNAQGLGVALIGLSLLCYFCVRNNPAGDVRNKSLLINQSQCEKVFSLAVCDYIIGRRDLIEVGGYYRSAVRGVFILYMNNNRDRTKELSARQMRFQLQEMCGSVGHPEASAPIVATVNHAIITLQQYGINPNTRMNVGRVMYTIIQKLRWGP